MKHKLVLWIFMIMLLTLAACTPSPGLPGTGQSSITPAVPQVTSDVTQPASTLPPAITQPPATQAVVTPPPIVTQPPANQPPATPTIDEISQNLADAFARRDLAALRNLMPARFSIATWNSSLVEETSDEALRLLGQKVLAPGANPQAQFATIVPDLLGGSDPLGVWGPVANVVRAIHVTGIGPDSQGEAVLVIGRNADTGQFYWHGILLPESNRFQASAPPPGEAFRDTLARALESRNIATLRSLMGERFSLAYWNSELINVTAEEAMAQLLAGSLAEGAQPVVRWGTDLTALLSGSDPLALWGPTAQVVEAYHVMGLGANANQEAMIVIDRDAQGVQRWHGMLIPLSGSFQQQSNDPSAPLPTDVKYVMAQDDINVRTGPGFNYAVEGMIADGQIAKVSGISADGQWWQIICTQDASGHCWISADPDLTEPTTAP